MSTFDLHKQIEAAKVLTANLADILAKDPGFLPEAIEAETSLFEALNALVASVREDEAMADGVEKLTGLLKTRKEALERRAETKRALIASALEIACLTSHEAPAGTVSLKVTPPKVIITEEADIPSKFFTSPDPVISRKALGEALKFRAAALSAAADIEDEDERDVARAQVERDFPPIPGATLSNGGMTVAIRG